MKLGLFLSILSLLFIAGCSKGIPTTFCEGTAVKQLEYKELEEIIKPIISNAEDIEQLESWLRTQPCVKEVNTRWSEPTKGQVQAQLSEGSKILIITVGKDSQLEKITFETVYISEMKY
ncbi:MAG TPA: hypothetical protein VJG49_00020 [Candidatus Nanoarchaeia archaeon]|nr:hypothetical protein [Candidatus Nanoarchaeia archaeon]